MADTVKGRKMWKKILYERQEYPDNYLDEEQFKKDLKKNLFIKTQSINEVIRSPIVLNLLQEINSVFLFLSVFWQLEGSSTVELSPIILVGICFILAFLLFACAVFLVPMSSEFDVFECVKQSLLFVLFLSGTSPILRTLTESISTDSLWFLTVTMFLGHLVFHKYGISGVLVSEAFSLNAAIFAAVCLASRLPTSLHAFAMIIFAVTLFALLPQLRNLMNGTETNYRVFQASTLLLFVFVLSSLSTHVEAGPVCIFILCHALLVVGLLVFVKLQFIKNTIHGPWDEAAVNLNES